MATVIDHHCVCLFGPLYSLSEPVFVNLLRSPGIDSQPGRPVRQPIWRTGPPSYIGCGIDSLESIPGFLKRLQIQALYSKTQVGPSLPRKLLVVRTVLYFTVHCTMRPKAWVQNAVRTAGAAQLRATVHTSQLLPYSRVLIPSLLFYNG
jgi:hypothetical protein